jgi:hypothetical protein
MQNKIENKCMLVWSDIQIQQRGASWLELLNDKND